MSEEALSMREEVSVETGPTVQEAVDERQPAAEPDRGQGGEHMKQAIAELRGVVDTMKLGVAASNQTTQTDGTRIRWDSFWSVAVDIQAVLGTAELTVRQLLELESGQMLPLGRGLDEPLELMVNGRVIAKAELEKDEMNRLSLRVTELLDTSADKSAN